MTLSGGPGSQPCTAQNWAVKAGALLNFVSSRAWISVSDTLMCLPAYWGKSVSGRMHTPLGCEGLNLVYVYP